jgi:hypothetical protein
VGEKGDIFISPLPDHTEEIDTAASIAPAEEQELCYNSSYYAEVSRGISERTTDLWSR